MIAHLAQIDPGQLTILRAMEKKPEGYVALVVGSVEIYLPLAGLVDVSEERRRLEKELEETLTQIRAIRGAALKLVFRKSPASRGSEGKG